MCARKSSNNLENLSLHHPSGMLDRDQRTILTLPKNQRDFKSIVNSYQYQLDSMLLVNNNKVGMNNENDERICQKTFTIFSQNESIKKVDNLSCNNNNNINIKPNNSNELEIKTTQQPVLLNIKQKTYYTRNKESNIARKPTSSTFHVKKLKFSNLFICIGLWLLILQKARAIPIRRMDDDYTLNGRSQPNNQIYCSNLRDAIDKILHQTNISYEVNIGSLENYTQSIFNERHKDQHNMWRKTVYNWLYPDEEPLEIEDYDQELPEHIVARYKLPHVPEMEEISRELTNLYRRLKILNAAIETIREDHERSKHILMNQYPGERFNHMVKFFSDQYNYLRALLHETESSMIQLGVAVPEIIDRIQDFNGSREIRDWIVTREHLKLLNYVLKVYDILLQRCS